MQHERVISGNVQTLFGLSEAQFRGLAGLALVDGTNVADQIRMAVGAYAHVRTGSPTLPEEIAAMRTRQVRTENAKWIESIVEKLGLSDLRQRNST